MAWLAVADRRITWPPRVLPFLRTTSRVVVMVYRASSHQRHPFPFRWLAEGEGGRKGGGERERASGKRQAPRSSASSTRSCFCCLVASILQKCQVKRRNARQRVSRPICMPEMESNTHVLHSLFHRRLVVTTSELVPCRHPCFCTSFRSPLRGLDGHISHIPLLVCRPHLSCASDPRRCVRARKPRGRRRCCGSTLCLDSVLEPHPSIATHSYRQAR